MESNTFLQNFLFALGTDDADCDSVMNDKDNCPLYYNPGQQDRNKNKIGDHCEVRTGKTGPRLLKCDVDKDGIHDAVDNCRNVRNPSQTDTNKNGIGDACEKRGAKPVTQKREPELPVTRKGL